MKIKTKDLVAIDFCIDMAEDMLGAFTGDPDPTVPLEYELQIRRAKKLFKRLKAHSNAKLRR